MGALGPRGYFLSEVTSYLCACPTTALGMCLKLNRHTHPMLKARKPHTQKTGTTKPLTSRLQKDTGSFTPSGSSGKSCSV